VELRLCRAIRKKTKKEKKKKKPRKKQKFGMESCVRSLPEALADKSTSHFSYKTSALGRVRQTSATVHAATSHRYCTWDPPRGVAASHTSTVTGWLVRGLALKTLLLPRSGLPCRRSASCDAPFHLVADLNCLLSKTPYLNCHCDLTHSRVCPCFRFRLALCLRPNSSRRAWALAFFHPASRCPSPEACHLCWAPH